MLLICSIRIFSIALVICLCFVLPVNYFGDEKPHPEISSESLNVFTIANVNEKSRWYVCIELLMDGWIDSSMDF